MHPTPPKLLLPPLTTTLRAGSPPPPLPSPAVVPPSLPSPPRRRQLRRSPLSSSAGNPPTPAFNSSRTNDYNETQSPLQSLVFVFPDPFNASPPKPVHDYFEAAYVVQPEASSSTRTSLDSGSSRTATPCGSCPSLVSGQEPLPRPKGTSEGTTSLSIPSTRTRRSGSPVPSPPRRSRSPPPPVPPLPPPFAANSATSKRRPATPKGSRRITHITPVQRILPSGEVHWDYIPSAAVTPAPSSEARESDAITLRDLNITRTAERVCSAPPKPTAASAVPARIAPVRRVTSASSLVGALLGRRPRESRAAVH